MQRAAAGRRFPIGAEILDDGGAHLRVWAPARRRVEVVVVGDARAVSLSADGDGYFAGAVPGLHVGGRYGFRLDGEDRPYADPASRYQPEGPHGPSEVVDPERFAWTDAAWKGLALRGQAIYEMHVGTFTPEGTYAAAARQLPALRDLGVTVLELMPLAEFPGRFGWGYDGVDLWAPSHLYGTPDDLRRLVDAAHAVGMGVIQDVVYNHLGPDGNVLPAFSPHYLTDRHQNEWGQAIDFDGEHAGPVRAFFVENAGYWIEEFHLDGLRLDATQAIFDASADHVLAAIARRVRAAARGRGTLLVAENERQEARLVRPAADGGHGLDATWNDDFHHSARVALTGSREAYYHDHAGSPQELISALRWGTLFQGQWYAWQKQPRGTPALDLPAPSFVAFIENHDQVANSARGARLADLTTPGRLRAMTAVLLLAPATPMLFQGQEYGTRRPFLYFADHNPELGQKVARGRGDFLAQFPSLGSAEARTRLDDPTSPDTFARCKLDHRERETHAASYALHRDLLALRRAEAAFSQQRADRLHGAVLGPEAFVVRFFADRPGDHRLLLVNLGADLLLSPIPEPLLAPAAGTRWRIAWSSEDPRYGGAGTRALETDARFVLPGHAALVLAPEQPRE